MNSLSSNLPPSELSHQIDQIIQTTNQVLLISTRAAHDPLLSLKVMDHQKLQLIHERMAEIDRATQCFGKTNSQTTSRLMTLPMLNEGPYRMMNQCLAQIEAKRNALKESSFKIKKEILEIKRLQVRYQEQKEKLEAMSQGELINSFELENLKIDLEYTEVCLAEKITYLTDATHYYEAALKEIAIYQESYEEIRRNHQIPEKWDEVDFEKAEIKAHIKTAFRLAVRDIEMSGRLNCATMEYFEQFGINPLTAKNLVLQYYQQQETLMQGSEEQGPRMPNLYALQHFLEEMAEFFKESYRDAMKVRGLETHISEWAAYTKS